MNYKITKLQIKILTWIAKRIVVQSCCHESNITTYYRIIADAAKSEFREDNKITLDDFLTECHRYSLR